MASRNLNTQKGFTIIEVMLFLAITGLMLIGIFSSLKNNIDNQRYSTAVTSFQSYFQDQYSKVQNVRNDRPSTMTCSVTGVTTGGAATNIGTSQTCSIIGRMIVAGSSKELTSYPIYATKDTGTFDDDTTKKCEDGTNNILSSSCVAAVVNKQDTSDTYQLAWDTSMREVKASSGTAISARSIAIYRSPFNGQIAMQWSKKSTTDMSVFLANLTAGSVNICVDRSGWTTIPEMGVMLDSTTAGSSNAVTRIAGGTICQ